MSKVIIAIVTVAVLVVVFFNFVWPQIAPMVDNNSGVVFTSGSTTHGELGTNDVDFTTPILRESRTRRELVVYEQDVETSSTVSSTPANIELFKKSTTVHSFGTGVYTVDLSAVGESSVVTDTEKKTVTVTVPHACLQYITEDLDRTEFEQTERGLLAFGELTLTQQQQTALKQTVMDQMRAELTTESCYAKADVAALDVIYDLLSAVVKKVDPTYTLVIAFDDTTSNEDHAVAEE